MSASDKCENCNLKENAEHFFFRGEILVYADQRHELFIETRVLHPLNVNRLLFDDPNLTIDQNISIAIQVQSFIKQPGTFPQRGPMTALNQVNPISIKFSVILFSMFISPSSSVICLIGLLHV